MTTHRTANLALQDHPSLMAQLWDALDHLAKLKARANRRPAARSRLSMRAYLTYLLHVEAIGRAVRRRIDRHYSEELLRELPR